MTYIQNGNMYNPNKITFSRLSCKNKGMIEEFCVEK